MTRTIGIDLAIRGDHVGQIFDDGHPVGKPIRFRNDPASLDAFIGLAIEGMSPGETVQALMEPTGMSWFPVAHRLADAGVEVIRVKGQRVRALRRYLSEHAKTDLADAQVLGAMPLFGGPRFDPVHIPAPKSHALQRLTKQRSRFQDAVAGAKRRLLDLVRWASPGLEAVLPDLRTRLSLALLQNWVDPAAVLKARRSSLARFVGRNASGNHPHSGPFVDALVDGLKRAARDAVALHGRHVDFTELQAEVALEVGIILRHLEAIAELDRRIAALYVEIHPFRRAAHDPGRRAASRSGADRCAAHFRTLPLRAPHPWLLRAVSEPRRFRVRPRPGQKISQSGNDRIKRAFAIGLEPMATQWLTPRRRHRPADRPGSRRGG